MKTRRLNWTSLVPWLVSGGLLLVSFLLINFTYSANDDLTMATILNGSYSGTPDGHAIFISYPLGALIALLYRTGIQISWYQATMMVIYFFAIGSICHRLLRRLHKYPVAACLLTTAGVCLLWLTNIMQFTFSTCGAFVGAALILCYALQTPEEDLRPGYLISILLLFLLTYQIRDYFAYLTIPFLGVIWLSKYWKVLFRNKRCWLIPLSALVLLGLSIGVEKIAYRDWDAYFQYNEERVYLQDYYNFPDYETHQEFINSLGYDKDSYYSISHYDYNLLPSFSPEVIHELSEYAKTLEPETSLASTVKSTLKRAIDYYFVDSWEDIHPLQAASYLLPALLVLCSILWSIRDRKWYVLFSFLLLFGIGCSYLYIAYGGRFPTRVAYSLRILTISASLAGLALLWMARPIRLKKEALVRPAALAGTVLLLLITLWGFWGTRQELGAPRSSSIEYLSYITQYPDNIYIQDIRSTQYDKEMLSEFPRLSPNVLSTGGWSTFSPIFEEKLAQAGLEQLNRDTLFQDNVYLIVREKYPLHQILGVSADTPIDYDVVRAFDDGIQILDIHSIQD